MAKGRAVALTPGKGNDAVAALRVLQGFYDDTGKRLSLLDSVAGYCGAMRRLGMKARYDAALRPSSTA